MPTKGIEATNYLLLIIPVILLLISRIVQEFFSKRKSPAKSADNISSLMQEHSLLLKNLTDATLDNPEQKLKAILEKFKGSSSDSGFEAIKNVTEFYNSRVESINAYARNPQAFNYKLSKIGELAKDVEQYEQKVTEMEELIKGITGKIDPKKKEEETEKLKKEIDDIIKNYTNFSEKYKAYLEFAKNKLPLIAENINNISSADGEKLISPATIIAGVGIVIGLIVIFTRLDMLLGFFGI